jgi:hypothetical protein
MRSVAVAGDMLLQFISDGAKDAARSINRKIELSPTPSAQSSSLSQESASSAGAF